MSRVRAGVSTKAQNEWQAIHHVNQASIFVPPWPLSSLGAPLFDLDRWTEAVELAEMHHDSGISNDRPPPVLEDSSSPMLSAVS